MRITFFLALAAGMLASTAWAGQRLGPLPPGAVARSTAGPADEIIGYLAFDPAPLAARVPPGVRFRTLAEKAAEFPGIARYLAAHPERRGWAWSYFEIIGIRAARYDSRAARYRGGRGGMAVWYADMVRTDSADPRPLGDRISRSAAGCRTGAWRATCAAAAFRRPPPRSTSAPEPIG